MRRFLPQKNYYPNFYAIMNRRFFSSMFGNNTTSSARRLAMLKVADIHNAEFTGNFLHDEISTLKTALEKYEVTYYDLLGVNQLLDDDAFTSKLKQQYRRLILRFHPDVAADSQKIKTNEEIFKCIDHGYRILVERQKRNEYDSRLAENKHCGSEKVCNTDTTVAAAARCWWNEVDTDKVNIALFLQHWTNIQSLVFDVSEYHEMACHIGNTTSTTTTNSDAGMYANALIQTINVSAKMLKTLSQCVTDDFQIRQFNQIVQNNNYRAHACYAYMTGKGLDHFPAWAGIDCAQSVFQRLLRVYSHNTNLYGAAKESDTELTFGGGFWGGFFNLPSGTAPSFKQNIVEPLLQIHKDILKLLKTIISKCSHTELMQLFSVFMITDLKCEPDFATQAEKSDVVKALHRLSMGQLLNEKHANELFLKVIKYFDYNVIYLFYDLINNVRLDEINVSRALLDAANNGNVDVILRCGNLPISVLYEVARQASNPAFLYQLSNLDRCDDILRKIIIGNMCLYPHQVTRGFFSNSENMNSILPIILAFQCLRNCFPKYSWVYTAGLNLSHYIDDLRYMFENGKTASDTFCVLDYALESFENDFKRKGVEWQAKELEREGKQMHHGLVNAIKFLRKQIYSGCRPIDIDKVLSHFHQNKQDMHTPWLSRLAAW